MRLVGDGRLTRFPSGKARLRPADFDGEPSPPLRFGLPAEAPQAATYFMRLVGDGRLTRFPSQGKPVFALRASTGSLRPRSASACQPKRRRREGWWAVTDSNRRHPACKAGALPTELTALASPYRRSCGRGKAAVDS